MNIIIATVENEARILDLDLAAALEYEQLRDIRKLIKRHSDALQQFGMLRATVAQTHENNGLGGSPATEFYLNKQQAIFITTQSKTPKAIDITIELVKRFDAYERGLISNQKPDSSVALEFAKLVMEHLPNLGDRSKQAVLSETSLLVFGTRTVPAPVVDEQFWTTTEIANECGVTPQRAGHIANKKKLKGVGFGEYRLSKSLHSDKQVEQFHWNKYGRDVFMSALRGEW